MLTKITEEGLNSLALALKTKPRPWRYICGYDREGFYGILVDGNGTVMLKSTDPITGDLIRTLLELINPLAEKIIQIKVADVSELIEGTTLMDDGTLVLSKDMLNSLNATGVYKVKEVAFVKIEE